MRTCILEKHINGLCTFQWVVSVRTHAKGEEKTKKQKVKFGLLARESG